MPSADARDDAYRRILLTPLRECVHYLPKMGGSEAVDFQGFRTAYGADPLYHWIGLDSEMMYAAHKAAGGMTSIYRQLGIGCERLFRQVIKDELDLSEAQVHWHYTVIKDDGKTQTLTLDGRIELSDVVDRPARERIRQWLEAQQKRLGISVPLKGVVFEVRQGYKSADSKRQNADLTSSAQALGNGYLMSLAVMSTQMSQVVKSRYEIANLPVMVGLTETDDSSVSTFAFLKNVVGFDIVSFFVRNTEAMHKEVTGILEGLLSA